jgi:hypothetical protein
MFRRPWILVVILFQAEVTDEICSSAKSEDLKTCISATLLSKYFEGITVEIELNRTVGKGHYNKSIIIKHFSSILYCILMDKIESSPN